MEVKNFGIHLKVKDIQRSYSFYSSFNLKPIFTYGRKYWLDMILEKYPALSHAEEKYEGITFEINNGLFEIANGHIAVKENIFKEDISSSKVSAMLDVDSVDEIVQICKLSQLPRHKCRGFWPWAFSPIN